ncbi:MAG: hypothetical protein ABSC64_02385 [Candidatus Korobacteraceae bacterium]
MVKEIRLSYKKLEIDELSEALDDVKNRLANMAVYDEFSIAVTGKEKPNRIN